MFAEFSKKSEKYKQRINFPISINSELVQKFNSLRQNREHLISAFSEYASGFEEEKEFHQIVCFIYSLKHYIKVGYDVEFINGIW